MFKITTKITMQYQYNASKSLDTEAQSRDTDNGINNYKTITPTTLA